MEIKLRKDTIVILSGVPGSGKSTFAKKHFKEEQILSSDYFRKLIGGVFNKNGRIEPNQNVSARAFKLMEELTEERAKHGYLTVIDATNLEWSQIKPFYKIAEKYNRDLVIFFFDVPEEKAREWNLKRKEYVSDKVFEAFLEKKKDFFNSSKIQELKEKGKIFFINPEEEVKITYTPLSAKVIEINKDKTLIVGDIHGDLEALNKAIEIAKKEQAFIIFVGDIIDRGKDSFEVLMKVKELVSQKQAILIMGNHEHNLLKALNEEIERLSYSTSYTYNKVVENNKESEVKGFLESLPYGVLLNNKYFISHAALDIDPYKDFSYQYSDFSLIKNFGYSDESEINNNTPFVLIHGHINPLNKIYFEEKRIYNLTDEHKEKNKYFALLIY